MSTLINPRGSGGNTGDQGLDALKNPFKLPGRFASSAVTSIDDIARGIFRAGGAILSDNIAEPARWAWSGVTGGDHTPWNDGGDFHLSTYEDLLKPVGQSFLRTGQLLEDVALAPTAIWDEDRRQSLLGHAQEFNDDPFFFMLEHVGNVAIGSSVVSAPARAGITAAAKGAGRAGQAQAAATSLRPFAGRGTRREARQTTRELAQQARGEGRRFSAPQVASFAGDIVGHPYWTLGSNINRSRFMTQVRDPQAFTRTPELDATPVQREAPLREHVLEDLDVYTDPMAPAPGAGRVGTEGPSRTSAGEMHNPLDDLQADIFAQQQAVSNRPTGTSTDPGVVQTSLDSIAQGIGHSLESMRQSRGYQRFFAPDVKAARKIGEDTHKGIVPGQGRVAEAARRELFELNETLPDGQGGMLSREQVGDLANRRKLDPTRTEQFFLSNVRELRNRPDAAEFATLLDELPMERITPATAVGRAHEVASGRRTLGDTVNPEQLANSIERVVDEAYRRAEGDASVANDLLRDWLPDVDPVSLSLVGLNAIENVRGMGPNSLTSALADYVTMDRFAQTNMRAQAALREAGRDLPLSDQARFRIPDEHMVSWERLNDTERRLFERAAEQYRDVVARRREPYLIERGDILPGGTRAGLSPDQPTRFPETLEELPLTPETRRSIAAAQEDLAAAKQRVEKRTGKIEELEARGEPIFQRSQYSSVHGQTSLLHSVGTGETRPPILGLRIFRVLVEHRRVLSMSWLRLSGVLLSKLWLRLSNLLRENLVGSLSMWVI